MFFHVLLLGLKTYHLCINSRYTYSGIYFITRVFFNYCCRQFPPHLQTLQTSHADFFPRLQKNEAVSDPVKAWNIGNADTLKGPKDEPTRCTGICCTFSPEPYVIQNSSTGSVLATEGARTITSVSLVLILMRWWPLNDASRAWIISRVSASSWVHGARLLISDLWLEVSTLLPWVE